MVVIGTPIRMVTWFRQVDIKMEKFIFSKSNCWWFWWTTGGTTNWNDSTNARSGAGYTLLLGNHSNGLSGTGDYFHPHSYEYNSKDGNGNMCQFNIPYIVGNGGGMYMRRYSGGWGGWVKFLDSNNMYGIARTSNTYGYLM